MSGNLKVWKNRVVARKLPTLEEIESFGADGEEAVCRILCENFDCVIRNVAVPHKNLYLEKDFMVIHQGVPFVLEIKNWKGTVGCDGRDFYQDKENGVHKTLKSPVGTTNQFLSCMREFYGIDRSVYGMVVFVEPDCVLDLPAEMEGIALLPVGEMVNYIRRTAKSAPRTLERVDPARILRCTRFYSRDSEFCKGIVADPALVCYTEDGEKVEIDTTCVRFITVDPQPLRLRDRLFVTYTNGEGDIFYNRDTTLTVACLDGSYRKIAVSRVRHIVF